MDTLNLMEYRLHELKGNLDKLKAKSQEFKVKNKEL